MLTSLPARSVVIHFAWLMLATGAWSADGRVINQPGSSSSSSSWSSVLSLKISQRITVAMDGRSSFDAVFQNADDSSLTVIAYGGTGVPERLPRAAIQRITTMTPNPQRKRAAGFVVAGFAAMIIGAAAKSPEAGPSAGFWIGLPLIGIGAYGWDQTNKHPMLTTIYQRPSPKTPSPAPRTPRQAPAHGIASSAASPRRIVRASRA